MDTFGFEKRVKLAIALEEEIFLAASDPEQFEVAIHASAVFEGSRDAVGRRGRRAECANPPKLIVMVQGDRQRVVSSHR